VDAVKGAQRTPSDLHHAPVRLTLRPGKKGTRAMVDKYGARLVAVRYRYDRATGQRLKTVELIEEVAPWRTRERRDPQKLVRLRIKPQELALHVIVGEAGGRRGAKSGAWYVPYSTAIQLGLRSRIVHTTSSGIRSTRPTD
jgi:hypothetical protein